MRSQTSSTWSGGRTPENAQQIQGSATDSGSIWDMDATDSMRGIVCGGGVVVVVVV